ncbi:MAG: ATP-grasp domain-containing protein, partial [Planctomycetaceae bacterium]
MSEFVCGGAWPGSAAPRSLLREGRAMLQALVADFARVPECRVVTTLAADQEPLDVPGAKLLRVRDSEEEAVVFRSLAAECDASLIIAPELGNVLYERCQSARRAGAARLLNPASELVRLCSDKLELARFLAEHNIPTIPTVSWPVESAADANWSPAVIKPRFGAGSQEIHTCDSVASARTRRPVPAAAQSWIAQPLIRGAAVSVGALCHPGRGVHEMLPVAAQHLSDDGRFRYLGGRIPWDDRRSAEVQDAVRRACRMLPDLAGYVGFDVVVPDTGAEPPLVVEINPRLCTSYLGY